MLLLSLCSKAAGSLSFMYSMRRFLRRPCRVDVSDLTLDGPWYGMHEGQCHVSYVDARSGVIGGDRVDPSCHSLQLGASHWM